MGTIINTNVTALNSHRSMKLVSDTTQKASEKLSSGLRINRAGDDAAGLAISEKMRSQIRGLNQASRNSQDGISLIQTAEGALQETEDMLQRMRELVNQAANDTNEATDRDKIALELDQLSKEIDATAEKTEFNKKKLIDGSWEAKQLYLQVGANEIQNISFGIEGMNSSRLGVTMNEIGSVVRNANVDTNQTNVQGSFGKVATGAAAAAALGVSNSSEASSAAGLGSSLQASQASQATGIGGSSNLSTFSSTAAELAGIGGTEASNADGLGMDTDSEAVSAALIGNSGTPSAASQAAGLGGYPDPTGADAGKMKVSDGEIIFGANGSITVKSTSLSAALGFEVGKEYDQATASSTLDGKIITLDDGSMVRFTKASKNVNSTSVDYLTYEHIDATTAQTARADAITSSGSYVATDVSPTNANDLNDSKTLAELKGSGTGASIAIDDYTFAVDGDGNISLSTSASPPPATFYDENGAEKTLAEIITALKGDGSSNGLSVVSQDMSFIDSQGYAINFSTDLDGKLSITSVDLNTEMEAAIKGVLDTASSTLTASTTFDGNQSTDDIDTAGFAVTEDIGGKYTLTVADDGTVTFDLTNSTSYNPTAFYDKDGAEISISDINNAINSGLSGNNFNGSFIDSDGFAVSITTDGSGKITVKSGNVSSDLATEIAGVISSGSFDGTDLTDSSSALGKTITEITALNATTPVEATIGTATNEYKLSVNANGDIELSLGANNTATKFYDENGDEIDLADFNTLLNGSSGLDGKGNTIYLMDNNGYSIKFETDANTGNVKVTSADISGDFDTELATAFGAVTTVDTDKGAGVDASTIPGITNSGTNNVGESQALLKGDGLLTFKANGDVEISGSVAGIPNLVDTTIAVDELGEVLGGMSIELADGNWLTFNSDASGYKVTSTKITSEAEYEDAKDVDDPSISATEVSLISEAKANKGVMKVDATTSLKFNDDGTFTLTGTGPIQDSGGNDIKDSDGNDIEAGTYDVSVLADIELKLADNSYVRFSSDGGSYKTGGSTIPIYADNSDSGTVATITKDGTAKLANGETLEFKEDAEGNLLITASGTVEDADGNEIVATGEGDTFTTTDLAGKTIKLADGSFIKFNDGGTGYKTASSNPTDTDYSTIVSTEVATSHTKAGSISFAGGGILSFDEEGNATASAAIEGLGIAAAGDVNLDDLVGKTARLGNGDFIRFDEDEDGNVSYSVITKDEMAGAAVDTETAVGSVDMNNSASYVNGENLEIDTSSIVTHGIQTMSASTFAVSDYTYDIDASGISLSNSSGSSVVLTDIATGKTVDMSSGKSLTELGIDTDGDNVTLMDQDGNLFKFENTGGSLTITTGKAPTTGAAGSVFVTQQMSDIPDGTAALINDETLTFESDGKVIHSDSTGAVIGTYTFEDLKDRALAFTLADGKTLQFTDDGKGYNVIDGTTKSPTVSIVPPERINGTMTFSGGETLTFNEDGSVTASSAIDELGINDPGTVTAAALKNKTAQLGDGTFVQFNGTGTGYKIAAAPGLTTASPGTIDINTETVSEQAINTTGYTFTTAVGSNDISFGSVGTGMKNVDGTPIVSGDRLKEKVNQLPKGDSFTIIDNANNVIKFSRDNSDALTISSGKLDFSASTTVNVSEAKSNSGDLVALGAMQTLDGAIIQFTNDGKLSVNGTLKDTNNNPVSDPVSGKEYDLANSSVDQSKLGGRSILTDKGTITFSTDGKVAVLDPNRTSAGLLEANESHKTRNGSTIATDSTGKVIGVEGKITTHDGKEIGDGSTTKIEDLAGKTIRLEDGRFVSFDANLKASVSDDISNIPNTERNELAEKADKEAAAALESSLSVGEDSPGKKISALLVKIDAAIESVSSQRANLGALQNRLEHTIKNVDTASENLSAAESRVRDTDMAAEMMNFTKSNVLSQAAMSMLAQANQAPNNVLSLLR